LTLDIPALGEALRALYHRGATVELRAARPPAEYSRYRHDPVGFIRDVLGKTLTPDQIEICNKFTRIGARVKVNSGHSVGKSFLAACLILWWFYTRPESVVITTAPTARDVITILWTEVRILHRRSKQPLPDFFVGTKAPAMFEHEEHWAQGYTSSSGESFQGRHRESMLFVFDESEGIDEVYWTTTGTMFQPDNDHAWLAIGNPTTTSSQSYLEDLATAPGGGPKWELFSLSALNHPNIAEQLAGGRPSIPNAVTLAMVEQWIEDWTDPVPATDRQPRDVEWPPGSGKFIRPGPSFLSRVLGKRPTDGVDTVWGETAFQLCVNPAVPSDTRLRLAWAAKSGVSIGVDPAAFGDDDTSLHVRIGPVSVHHESHNGWGPDRTAARLSELCEEWTAFYNTLNDVGIAPEDPLDTRVVIEGDGGFGVGVHSHRGRYRKWTLASAASRCTLLSQGRPIYANLRSQWWMESAKLAAAGGVDLSRLPRAVQAKLRIQLLAPFYWLIPGGALKVEPKEDVKGRLKRSPDDADAFIISHHRVESFMPSVLAGDDEE